MSFAEFDPQALFDLLERVDRQDGRLAELQHIRRRTAADLVEGVGAETRASVVLRCRELSLCRDRLLGGQSLLKSNPFEVNRMQPQSSLSKFYSRYWQ